MNRARRKFLVILAVLMVIGASALLLWRQDDDSAAAAPSGKGKASVTTVSVAPVQQSDVPINLTSIGSVVPMRIVAVKARVQSELKEQHFTEGQTVAKGDLLFVLDDAQQKAAVERDQALVAKDQAQKANTAANLKRNQQLVTRNAGTQQALDQAVADDKSADAAILQDQATLDADKLQLSYTKIYAPLAGRVGAVTVTPGNLVAANGAEALVTITQMRPVWVQFTLPERYLAQAQKTLQEGAPDAVKVKPPGGTTTSGKLTFIDSSIDQASGTVTLKAEFPNEDMSLWPGRYVDVEVEVGVDKNALSVPSQAVQIGQKGSYVFAVKDGQKAQLRWIKTGATVADRIEVNSGLEAGDSVVVEGQLRLDDGSPVRVAPPQTQAAAEPPPQGQGAPATGPGASQ